MVPLVSYKQSGVRRLPFHDRYERLGLPFVERDGWLLPRRFLPISQETEILEGGEALLDLSDRGVLQINGKDAIDFLHRISTNSFRAIRSGDALPTLLLSDKGRIIDSLLVMHQGDHLLAVAGRSAQETVKTWLEKYVISEDVSITDVTGKYLLFAILGTKKSEPVPLVDSQWLKYSVYYFGLPSVLFVSGESPNVVSGVPVSGYTQVGDDASEFFRFRHGIPRFGAEIDGESNPLELNLKEAIDFEKGCYIGQEVIARLDTYGKVQRRLCRVKMTGSVGSNNENRLMLGEINTGRMTSWMPVESSPLSATGLALLRKDYATAGSEYALQASPCRVLIEHVFEEEANGHRDNISGS